MNEINVERLHTKTAGLYLNKEGMKLHGSRHLRGWVPTQQFLFSFALSVYQYAPWKSLLEGSLPWTNLFRSTVATSEMFSFLELSHCQISWSFLLSDVGCNEKKKKKKCYRKWIFQMAIIPRGLFLCNFIDFNWQPFIPLPQSLKLF